MTLPKVANVKFYVHYAHYDGWCIKAETAQEIEDKLLETMKCNKCGGILTPTGQPTCKRCMSNEDGNMATILATESDLKAMLAALQFYYEHFQTNKSKELVQRIEHLIGEALPLKIMKTKS